MNIYTVVSEFRFNVAEAIYESEKLQSSVQGLSDTVNNAINSVKASGLSMMMSLTGAQAGIMGLLNSSIGASDKFLNSQLSLTQIIDSNMEHLSGTITTMNDKMAVSKKIMNDIAKDAQHFGLPAGELLEMTKMMIAMLIPKGLAGENFKNARDISRNMLKAAPNLGIDPAEVQGQLLRAIEGNASLGDTLFRRLLGEAPEPFKAANVKDAKGFNTLDTAKRFNILSDAMGKFTKNTELLEARANTLSGVMQRVKDTFYGFTSILKPFGDVLLPLISKAAQMILNWLQTHGKRIVEQLAGILKRLTDDPMEFILKLKQVSDLSKDLASAAEMAGIVILLYHLKEFITFATKLPIIGPAIGAMSGYITNFVRTVIPYLTLSIGGIFIALWKGFIFVLPILKSFIIGFIEFTGVVLAFFIPLQGLGRAIARMKIETLQWVAENMADLTAIFDRMSIALGKIFTPIEDLIKGFEELFYLVLGGTYFLDAGKTGLSGLADMLDMFGTAVMAVWSVLRGVVAGIIGMIDTVVNNIQLAIGNLMNGNFRNWDIGQEDAVGSFIQSFSDEFNKSFSRAQNPLVTNGVDNSKVSNVTNNYDVKMQNNFKEVLQPDRIAFTIKDQLEKSSMNRTKARSNSIGGLNAKAVT